MAGDKFDFNVRERVLLRVQAQERERVQVREQAQERVRERVQVREQVLPAEVLHYS